MNSRAQVTMQTSRATNGKKRVMFYKDGRLTKDENVPEETRNELLSILGKTEE